MLCDGGGGGLLLVLLLLLFSLFELLLFEAIVVGFAIAAACGT